MFFSSHDLTLHAYVKVCFIFLLRLNFINMKLILKNNYICLFFSPIYSFFAFSLLSDSFYLDFLVHVFGGWYVFFPFFVVSHPSVRRSVTAVRLKRFINPNDPRLSQWSVVPPSLYAKISLRFPRFLEGEERERQRKQPSSDAIDLQTLRFSRAFTFARDYITLHTVYKFIILKLPHYLARTWIRKSTKSGSACTKSS